VSRVDGRARIAQPSHIVNWLSFGMKAYQWGRPRTTGLCARPKQGRRQRMSCPGTGLPLTRIRPPPAWTSRAANTSVPMPPG